MPDYQKAFLRKAMLLCVCLFAGTTVFADDQASPPPKDENQQTNNDSPKVEHRASRPLAKEVPMDTFDATSHFDWGTYYDPKNVFCGKFDCYLSHLVTVKVPVNPPVGNLSAFGFPHTPFRWLRYFNSLRSLKRAVRHLPGGETNSSPRACHTISHYVSVHLPCLSVSLCVSLCISLRLSALLCVSLCVSRRAL